MNLTAYENLSLFEELKPEWNDLVFRSMSNRIFSTWEWQSTWWQAYQKRGQLWVITCRTEDGRLVGIAPWFIEEHPARGRIVRSIGCVDVTDYLDLILDADCTQPVMECFAGYLAEHRDRFDVLDLCNIPEYSPTFDLFPAILKQHGFHVEVSQQEVCPIIKLPDEWEDYLSTLDKKQRHEVRRKLRRAEGAPEGIDWYIVNATHDLKAEMERFVQLMAASDSQKAEFLRDSENLAFFQTMVPVMFESGWLQLSFLTIGGEAAASYLNFDYNRRILVYNSGLLQDYGHLSPGIVLLAYNIRHAIESGHDEFDFLRGNETYKYRMGGRDLAVYMLIAN